MSTTSPLVAMLTVARWGLGLVLALAVCLTIASPFIDFGGAELDLPVALRLDEPALPIRPDDPGTAAHIEQVRGSMRFQTTSKAAKVAPAAAVIVMLVAAFWLLGQLLALLRSVRDGHPFDSSNPVRIRRIGLVIISGELARAVVVFAANSYAVAHFTAESLRFSAPFDINFFAIAHGLIIVSIAEAFRVGTRLADDESLTI